MKERQLLRARGMASILWLAACVFLVLAFIPASAFAVDDSVCAEVKLEISQELTLERQAFDAHMRINNGLTHITLENVNVEVSFSDEEGNTVLASSDPNNTTALFFISLNSLENISAVDGTGTVLPATAADIHWLIIPSPGASNGVPQGTLYYVGATLTYTYGGEERLTEVSPDYIFVKPMPEFTLDYFLPTDVYGDDAFTPEIEPSIPFSLGVRVANNGAGVARDMKINSAQPKIVENELGLLIGFAIESCEVNGRAENNSLLVDFGDIDSNESSVARWAMTCSLSGQFVEFSADYSHSDELGGELTSLLQGVNTHFLVRDVLVDVPGRDYIRDFLAVEGAGYMVYESEYVDTPVVNQSTSSSLTGSGYNYTLSAPPTSGFMYVKLTDPHGGQKDLVGVVRSDGKRIRSENAWLSKTRNVNQEWEHYINLFDANTTSSYTVTFADAAPPNNAPVLQFIPDGTAVEERQISFIIEASDADGTTPSLSAPSLPALATLTDQGDGTGIFDWTPIEGQAGEYEITFVASDGVQQDSQRMVITVYSLHDTDGDTIPDGWEIENFGTLDRDGRGDYDGDGISDLDEFLNNTDPAETNQVPTIPQIYAPEDGAEVTVLQPALEIQNSIDPDNDPVSYLFEVYADEGMTTLVASAPSVAEGVGTTSWTVPVALNDNSWYFWRVRATDGTRQSQWAYGSFFVNTTNDPPGSFQVSSPKDNTDVDTLIPTLEITNSVDPDGDQITYGFEVFAEGDLITPVASGSGIVPGENGSTSWIVATALSDTTRYYWKASATDEHGATAETLLVSFLVDTSNGAPAAPVISAPALGSEVTLQEVDLVLSNATDPENDPLSYFFELDRVNTFDSAALQSSGAITEGIGSTSWHVSGLADNTLYFWRVKVSDGAAESGWVQGTFFVNTANDAPSIPTLKNPAPNAWVDTPRPTLEVNPSIDPDGDSLTYRFEVYSDAALTSLIAQGESQIPAWGVPLALGDRTWYHWRARAVDEHGATSGWIDVASFFVKDDGVDDPPEITILEPAVDLLTNAPSILIRWEDTDPDSNATIALYYDTDTSGEDGVLIAGAISEDFDGPGDSYLWNVTGVADGTYFVYATIADDASTSTIYNQFAITIDTTPPTVQATPPGGEYLTPRTVTLTSDEAADIYYTTDGTEPTANSSLYSAPLVIGSDTTIKFMAVDAVGNQSITVTEAYTILDTDSDGMLDGWEVTYFGDLSRDGTGDFDGDELSDLDEHLNDTDPTNADTDADGMHDGWEVDNELNPVADDAAEDLDGDGFANLAEYQSRTLPNDYNSTPQPPVIASITLVPEVIQLGNATTLTATFTDPDPSGTHTVSVDWGDATLPDYYYLDSSVFEVNGDHTYTEVGVYTLTVTVTDDATNVSDSLPFLYAVVYDPEGGFVTGGGWINSPEGAYTDDPSLTGKANFGFVSKYHQGAQLPTGETQFRFKVADLNFHSDSYDWLVIAGAKAQYKGVGTINGAGSYKFILTGIDADINQSDVFDIDRFRIRIWYEIDDIEYVVYDNALGDDDNLATTEIGGGSIKIHEQ